MVLSRKLFENTGPILYLLTHLEWKSKHSEIIINFTLSLKVTKDNLHISFLPGIKGCWCLVWWAFVWNIVPTGCSVFWSPVTRRVPPCRIMECECDTNQRQLEEIWAIEITHIHVMHHPREHVRRRLLFGDYFASASCERRLRLTACFVCRKRENIISTQKP